MKNPQDTNTNLDFTRLENPKNHEINSEDNLSIDQIGKAKIDALKDSIQEIGNMIAGRESLSSQIHSEGESLKNEINGYLKENERLQISSSNPEMEKNSLRHKKIEVAEMQMNEKIGCWKDIALLKKELREHQQELTEKEDRIIMLNGIMGEDN